MYSQQTSTSSYSRVAAAALLAVSAGACVGVAIAPAASSFYAPAAVRPVTSQVAVMNVPRVQMQAVNAPYGAEYAAAEMQAPIAQAPTVSGWTVLSGGLFAAAAALVAVAFKGARSESSEQIAMLATAGKKGAAKAAPKADRPLWFPSAVAPDYLDGSLPGDRGFDPFGFSKPRVYLQFSPDGNDITQSKNEFGKVIGVVKEEPDVLTGDALVPWSDAFGVKRLRECELIHGRWAMLFVLGALVGEAVTGVAWQNAGLVEIREGFSYFGNPLPFNGAQVTWFEVLTMGFVEVYRNTEMDIEKRVYPGGAFDPLGLASKDSATTFRLKEAEIKHCRLAMIAFLGFAAAAAKTGAGATTAFSIWAAGFN